MGQSLPLTATRLTFRVCEPEEVYDTATQLAALFPQPEAVQTAIYELLFNAIEHGNLQIGYALKGKLLHDGTLYDELRRRMALPEHRHKSVHIECHLFEDRTRLSIADAGAGFDWRRFVPRPFDGFNINGRGLFIAFRAPFDTIRFNASGNEVTCEMRH